MDKDLARMIDHTLLSAVVTPEAMLTLCNEATHYGFYSVCVNPAWVAIAKHNLLGTSVKVCTVVGFPLGATLSTVKVFEAAAVVDLGADEVDMVMPIHAAKLGAWHFVEDEIAAVVQAAKCPVKVILETCLLTDDEIVMACKVAEKAGATFVKTSTGFSKSGATVEHVALMRHSVSPHVGVKASGGVRTREQALAMVAAGANRIGSSGSVALVDFVNP